MPGYTPVLRGQPPMFRLFDRGQTVRQKSAHPLIPRIGIFFNPRGDAEAGLFQERKVMHPPLTTCYHQNPETEQTDDQLGFDRMSFFFPEYQSPWCRVGRSIGCSVTSMMIAPMPLSRRDFRPGKRQTLTRRSRYC